MAKKNTRKKTAPLTRFESAAGAALTDDAAGSRANDLVDAALADVHAGFAKEAKSGWDVAVSRLRAWTLAQERDDIIADTIAAAEQTRDDAFTAFVTVGIGGSDLSQRMIHDTLNDPYHNERVAAGDTTLGPEVYFAGNTFDPRRLVSLIDMLDARGMLATTAINVVSKSGRTAETISAMLLMKDRLQAALVAADPKAGKEAWRQNIIATTGPDPATSVLRRMNGESPFFAVLPIPDGVGGRFSIVSPVGLLFVGVTAPKGVKPSTRIKNAVAGLKAGHRMSLAKPKRGANPAYDLARWLHLAETRCSRSGIVFYNYADIPCVGEWFLQLYTESIQELGDGLSVTPVTGPTGNHSILNGVVGGPRDRVVLMVAWDSLGDYAPEDITIPKKTGIGGELAYFEGVPLDVAQGFSLGGTIADLTDNGVPNALLRVARRDEKSLFCFLRVLMDAVAVKGRLQGLHLLEDRKPNETGELTYLQDGVEGYKKQTLALAKAWKKK